MNCDENGAGLAKWRKDETERAGDQAEVIRKNLLSPTNNQAP